MTSTDSFNKINTILDELRLDLHNYFNEEINEKCIPYEIIKKNDTKKLDYFMYKVIKNQIKKNRSLLKDILNLLFTNSVVYIGNANNCDIKIDSLFFPELEHIINIIFSFMSVPYIIMIKKYNNGYMLSILERFY